MICRHCGSRNVVKFGRRGKNKRQSYYCKGCKKSFLKKDLRNGRKIENKKSKFDKEILDEAIRLLKIRRKNMKKVGHSFLPTKKNRDKINRKKKKFETILTISEVHEELGKKERKKNKKDRKNIPSKSNLYKIMYKKRLNFH